MKPTGEAFTGRWMEQCETGWQWFVQANTEPRQVEASLQRLKGCGGGGGAGGGRGAGQDGQKILYL